MQVSAVAARRLQNTGSVVGPDEGLKLGQGPNLRRLARYVALGKSFMPRVPQFLAL